MINSNTYSEVYEILSYMDKSIVMKIPIEILKKIKENRNKNYISNINPNDLFNPKNMQEQTIEVLSCLDVNFWMNNEKKKRLKEKYNKMEVEYQKSLREKYNPDDIFKNRTTFKYFPKEFQTEQIAIVEYKEKNFLQKLFDKIKHIFKRK